MKTTRLQGFTILEIVAALALFALLALLSASLLQTGFSASRTSQQSLAVTSTAQDQLERARGIVAENYDAPSTFSTEFENAEIENVTCRNVDVFGNVMVPATDCTTMGTPPARRITVTATENDEQVSLSLDVVE